MDNYKKQQDLLNIFNDDPFGLLDIKPTLSPVRNENERLVASFLEINDFYTLNNRAPVQQKNNMQESMLYFRLKGLRENKEKREILAVQDKYELLNVEEKVIETLEDIFNDDSFGLLDDDSEGLFDLQHIKLSDKARAEAEFVARRKPCKEFSAYEELFKKVQNDLSSGKRKLVSFKEDNLEAGNFYVHDGILLLLESVNITKESQSFASGARSRKDGRTRCIFENGTESNMLYRSLAKVLYLNGQVLTESTEEANNNFIEDFNNITEEDKESGFIYILQSESDKKEITSIKNLYKIGFSKITVEERIKNATQEPTYLMAPVKIVSVFKCYNMNPQKLEQLLHNFFGRSCLSLDIFDKKGKRHTPKEWFIAPIEIIEKSIHLVISGEIVGHRYNADKIEIVDVLDK